VLEGAFLHDARAATLSVVEDRMRYRELGKSGIKVSEISLGCWTMGGLNWVNGSANGWANVDEVEVARAIDFALERGVNHFDNADVYGNGRAERMLARILGPRSSRLVIASKVGHLPGSAEHAYEPAHIRHQCEQSLVNLKRDVIDVYYFHHGDFGPGDRYLDDAVAVMHKLRDEGKIRLIGQSAYSSDDFARVVPKVRPDVLQSWAHAMDTRFIDPGTVVRRLLDERSMSFVAFSPLAQGLLLGKYRPGSKVSFEEGDHRRTNSQFAEANLERVAPKIERLKERFGKEPKALSRAALQYLLAYPCVGCVIPGFRDLAQVEMNLAGADEPLTEQDVAYVLEAVRD
jgi:aryl-alcohol dehydrogenase-like predicted oxidoreductase